MSYSLTKDPRGAWSDPTLVLMAKPMMDINTAPVILADGSVIGMWRDHNGSPKNKYSTPHGTPTLPPSPGSFVPAALCPPPEPPLSGDRCCTRHNHSPF